MQGSKKIKTLKSKGNLDVIVVNNATHHKTKSLICKRIRKRLLEQGKNALILIVGDTGSSKSLSSIRLAMEVDPTFHPGRIAHQKGSDFMRVLNLPELRRGMAVIWDDVGKGLKKRDWYDMVNKAIVDVLQTFRIYGLCVIFNCPDPRLIDSNAIALFHYWGEMIKIDFKTEVAEMKFFEIQINRRTGKMYWKYPRARVGGKIKTLKPLRLKRPPIAFERQYEKDKRPAVKRTLDAATKLFHKLDAKQKIEALTDGEILDEILKDSEQFLKTYNKRTSIDKFAIMAKFKVGQPRANKIKAVIERMLFNGNHRHT